MGNAGGTIRSPPAPSSRQVGTWLQYVRVAEHAIAYSAFATTRARRQLRTGVFASTTTVWMAAAALASISAATASAAARRALGVGAEGVVGTRVRGGEDGVAQQRALVEEADVGQELDGRLAVLVHDALELDEVTAGVGVDGHIELAGGVLALAQELLAA